MKEMCLYLIVLFGSVIFNYYYDFGFFLKNGDYAGLWLFFYALLLPIGSLLYLFNNYGSSPKFRQNSLFIFLVYLLSVFLSAFDSFDFRKFEILGDGATKFIISSILIICFISSFGSYLFSRIKNRRENK